MNQSRVVNLLIVSLLALPGLAHADWPPSHCDHVVVLGADDTDQISFEHDGGLLSDNSVLVDARPNQLDALGEALDMMPETLCKAVHKVAFVYRAPEDSDDDEDEDEEESVSVVDAWTKSNDRQNLVYLNVWDDLYWNQNNIDRTPRHKAAAIQRMIHESTHCAVRMLQSQQKASPVGTLQERPDEDLWPESTRQMAREIIKKNRIDMGILREWQRMHEAFVAAGMAKPYWGDEWPIHANNMTSAEIAAAGFTTAYGGEKPMEDIAEMTSWAIVRNQPENPQDMACRIMNRRTGSSIIQDDAAIFTKLGFIQTLGFITEEAYKSCVGSLRIEASGQGYHSYKDGNFDRSYSGDMRGNLGRSEENGPIIFSISAEGSVDTSNDNVPVTMTLGLNVTAHIVDLSNGSNPYGHVTVEDASFARGVYFVGFRHNKYNRLQITDRNEGKLIVDVGQGVALVSRASLDGIEGSIAVQRIFNYSGGMLSAIAGDEPVPEPTKVTFKYDPQ